MLASQSQAKIEQFDPQNLQNAVWSFAKIGHREMPFYEAISSTCIQRISEFSVQDLTGTAWAFATLTLTSHLHVGAALVDVLAQGAQERRTQFAPRDIASTF